MELWTIIVVLLMIVVVYYAPRLLELWTFIQKARKLPTSKGLPILGHLNYLMVPPNKLVESFIGLAEKSPPFFVTWIGPFPVLLLRRARHLETILGSTKYIDKPLFYNFLKTWLGTGLLTSTGEKWQSQRKLLTPAFHFKILDNFIEVFAKKSEILVEKMKQGLGMENFNLYPLVNLCALDIISETAMGVQINAQTQNKESEYVNSILNITEEIMNRVLSPWLYPDFIYNLTPNGRRMKNYVRCLHNFTYQVIRERKQLYTQGEMKDINEEENAIGARRRLAFLDLLIETSDNGTKFTDEEIREEVDTFMFEGHDTTTAAISWALQLLAINTEAQDKVFEELESIFQGSDRVPTMKDLNEMKYLERAIKEALRIYPSVPMIGRQLKEDVELDGHVIPAGLPVVVGAYFTHIDTEQFPDPDTYNPDNFLPERVAKRHPYAYVPFSAGPRNCIGQKFALLEEKMVLSYVFRHYKLEAVGEIAIAIMDLILRPENGVQIKLSKRGSKFHEQD